MLRCVAAAGIGSRRAVAADVRGPALLVCSPGSPPPVVGLGFWIVVTSKVHLHPLAYLLGIEGAAILRGIRDGTADREFVVARLAEIRSLLADTELVRAIGVDAKLGGLSVTDVYRDWAPTYDEPGNQLIDLEQPVVHGILATLPTGDALDAGCGTGRHTAELMRLGHRVIGVDASPEMLAVARRRLPGADLRAGEITRLPVADGSVDLVVCALALVHIPDLGAALAEFRRVLRPGGQLLISDPHLIGAYLVPRIARVTADGSAVLPLDYQRPLSAYLTAALALGFQVLRCEELVRPQSEARPAQPSAALPMRVSWELLDRIPTAAATVFNGSPVGVVWHFTVAELATRTTSPPRCETR
jgi:SAM-dependent methyltransferase